MPEQTQIVTVADVDARISTQARTRLFAKNGGGTVDTTYQALCVAEANSRIRTWTRAAFPDGLYTTDDTIDPEAIGRGVDVVLDIASSRHLATDETSGYAKHGKEAMEFFRSLNRDRDARLPGSTQGAPLPVATITGTVGENNLPTNPYVRMASGQSQGGF